MRRLLLVSTSTVHGTGYLDHCAAELADLFAEAGPLLFVPYALADRDAYTEKARARFADLGFELAGIHRASDPVRAVEQAGGLFIGGGNTFRLLRELHLQGLLAPIRSRVREGMPYMGTSAGSNVACPTIKTTNDMPIVEPPSFEALGLIPFQINPHYLDADPRSTHMGETRETRIREYLEENQAPVVGLREGSMIRVEGEHARLKGLRPARLFQRGQAPRELATGSDLDFLLREEG